MPRTPRIDIPGLIYHVTNRGVKQLPLFFDTADFQQFFRLLRVTCDEFPFRLHVYCLMTNHYHLLLQTLDHSISRIMQYLNGCYGSYFNRKYKHTGHLFQGRFHSLPVQEDAYFTVASRYIHLNPVRAGLVIRPEDYPWSNYKAIIQGVTDPWADPSFLLGYFGKGVEKQRQGYKDFVEDYMPQRETITDKALLRMHGWGIPKQLRTFGQALSQQTQ